MVEGASRRFYAYTAPAAIRLLAQSSTVCSIGRGCHPSTHCALAEVKARKP